MFNFSINGCSSYGRDVIHFCWLTHIYLTNNEKYQKEKLLINWDAYLCNNYTDLQDIIDINFWNIQIFSYIYLWKMLFHFLSGNSSRYLQICVYRFIIKSKYNII